MMNKILYKPHCLFLCTFLVTIAACSSGKVAPEKAMFDELRMADYDAALQAAAVAEVEGATPELVALGRGIARFGQLLDRISLVASIVLNAVDSADTVADFRDDGFTTAGAATEEDEFHRLIDYLFQDFRVIAEDGYRQFAFLGTSKLDYQIDNLVLPVIVYPWLDISGRWTANDARFMTWIMGNVTSLIMLGQSVDLRFDLYKLAWAIVGPSAGSEELASGDNAEDHVNSGAPGIMSAVAYLLHDPKYPNFLGKSKGDVDGDGRIDGDYLPALSADISVRSWQSLNTFLENGGGNIITVNPDGESGTLLLDKRIRVNGNGKLDFSGKGEPGTFEMYYNGAFRKALQRVITALEAKDSTSYITIKDDVLPILLPPVTGLLDLLDLGSTADALLALFPRDDIDVLISIIGNLAIPWGLGLTPGAFLRNFAGLRGLLPPARSDLPRGQRNFIMEWECPGLLGSGITGSTDRYPQGHMTCQEYDKALTIPASAYKLKSAGHFEGVTDVAGSFVGKIADDQIASPWPYLPWPDGSMGGLLVFKEGEYLSSGTSNWQSGDSFLLNGWLAALAEKINGLPSF